MANQGYPPGSYPGTQTPIYPDDGTGDPSDQYAPGTQFFHTDFFPISQADTQESYPTTTQHLLALEEEKRRRNTAASARFRLKKKEREQALEKTASDMSDRVRQLEQKVGQLELENRWLRGLIVERRRKMSSAADEEEDTAEEIPKEARKTNGAAGTKKQGSQRNNKDVDSQRSPRRRNDGVGTY